VVIRWGDVEIFGNDKNLKGGVCTIFFFLCLRREMLTNPENVPVFDFFHGTNCFYSPFFVFFLLWGKAKILKILKQKKKENCTNSPFQIFVVPENFYVAPTNDHVSSF
jgi:hypothetical protein